MTPAASPVPPRPRSATGLQAARAILQSILDQQQRTANGAAAGAGKAACAAGWALVLEALRATPVGGSTATAGAGAATTAAGRCSDSNAPHVG